ncbi:MAG: bifunctional diaminohydroxyphosphoribosylaminopyrimidine deaminase/5-amino-6-(5-phosphoribosylamino)uracil reductase RibD [Rubripirellula sp.]
MTLPLENVSEETDQGFMREALDLAALGEGFVEPNPMVGCVLVRDGLLIGRGYHRSFGGPHAEVEALRSLADGDTARGATAYVTLEPCCHYGKTPPCSRALIDAGVRRVVVAMRDPFPSVDGGGLRELQEAGIETTVGVLCHEAESLNAPYRKRLDSGRPWVIAKWAMTLDGRIATAGGQSQWITGADSRAEVHRLRGRVDAVAVGMGTVDGDDPSLTARSEEPGFRPPRVATRAVFCRHRVPEANSKLVQSAGETPLTLVVGPEVTSKQRAAMRLAGASLIETETADPKQMVADALEVWGQDGMTNLMVEGGAELLASFFAAGEVDECHVYIGAKVFGGQSAMGPIGGSGVRNMADAWAFELTSLQQFGVDIRAVYRMPTRRDISR